MEPLALGALTVVLAALVAWFFLKRGGTAAAQAPAGQSLDKSGEEFYQELRMRRQRLLDRVEKEPSAHATVPAQAAAAEPATASKGRETPVDALPVERTASKRPAEPAKPPRRSRAPEAERFIELGPEEEKPAPEPEPPAAAAPTPPPPAAPAAALLDHEHEMMQRVLRVAPAPPAGQPAAGAAAALFPVELEEGAPGLRLDQLDRIVVERLSAPGEALPAGEPRGLEYLLQCLRRCSEEGRRVPLEDTHRLAMLQSIRSSLAAFLCTYLLSPEAFPLPPGSAPEGPADLAPRIRAAALEGGARGLPEGVLDAVGAEASGPDMDALLEPTVRQAARELRSRAPNLAAEWQEPLAVLAYLARSRAGAGALARLAWPGGAGAERLEARAVEEATLFGLLLSVSAAPDSRGMAAEAARYFPDPLATHGAALSNAMEAIQMAARTYRARLAAIFGACLRAGEEARERVLSFLAAACERNAKWTAMAPDRRALSTVGFTLNLSALMLDLAGPVAALAPVPGAPEAAWGPLLAKLDPAYFHEARRIDTAPDTKLAMETKELDHWVDQRNEARILAWRNKCAELEAQRAAGGGEAPEAPEKPEGRRDFAFATEAFFLCSRALRVGLAAAVKHFEQLQRAFQQAEDAMRAAEAPGGDAAQRAEARQRTEALGRSRLLFAALLTEPQTAAAAGRYFAALAAWAARLADAAQAGPGALPDEPPGEWAALPEHTLDDLFSLLAFYAQHLPDPAPVFEGPTVRHVVGLALYGIGSAKYVRNPYLRAKMAELVAELLRPRRTAGPGGLLAGERPLLSVHDLEASPAARAHLVPSCITLWVDAESTGSHTQFYDKFNIRRNLAFILKRAWGSPAFAASLREAAAAAPYTVTRFVNMLVNDCTFAMDEALRLLEALRRHEQNRRLPGYGEQEPEERRAQESAYESNLLFARQEIYFAENNLETVQGLVEHLPEALLAPEMCPRFAAMLNDLVNRLAGPQCGNLKVEDPERVRWQPKLLLQRALQAILRVAPRPEFVAAAVRDERSFSVPVLRRAGALARRLGLLLPDELEAWAAYEAGCERAAAAARADEELFEDPPEELQDPLLGTLMRDPVRLPCGQITDRAVITRHLLSEETCPFTRARLTLAMLEPLPELKERADAFVAQRRAARAQQP